VNGVPIHDDPPAFPAEHLRVQDQATALRDLLRPGPAGAALSVRPPQPTVRLAKTIAITSGKGGVGKSNLAVNLAAAIASRRSTCLLDADLGLANADLLCGVSPGSTLEDVVQGRRRLADVMLVAPGGFRLLPGASGVASVANLAPAARRELVIQLAGLERSFDVLLVDTGAGIGANSMAFTLAADSALVVVTPEPTSITDAYGAIKTIAAKVAKPRIRVAVNMASGESEGSEVFRRLDRVARHFLSLPLELAGIVPHDEAVRDSVRKRIPFLVHAPDSPASRAVRAIADRLLGEPSHGDPVAGESMASRGGFLGRLAGWLGRTGRG
jgi:flagellar biosynthesis protein FlhG